jgi:multicomponent Na+:H+ antiporter subunit G
VLLLSGLAALVGSALVFLAAVGALRFSDLYSRMHAATKASTLGLLLVAVSATLVLDAGRAKVALAVVLIFVTAPVAAHLVGRAAYQAEGIELRIDSADELGDDLRAEPLIRHEQDP